MYKNPEQNCSKADSKIITSDIANFYKAFDLAVKDTANAENIFQKEYFGKASKGLKDFYKYKIKDSKRFTATVLYYKNFYQSVRKDINALPDVEQQVKNNFSKFKKLYPDAISPDIYFVVGSFSSNGTVSKRGLLIGTELLSRTETTDIGGWTDEIKSLVMQRSHIPVTVAHELVHFNQQDMGKATTLLGYALKEGSAEFIAEVVTGSTDGNYDAFKGREKAIFKDFKADMHTDVYNSWHQANEPKRPRNALYWAGYIICKSYYMQVNDKAKAVKDILSIKDYSTFYKASKVEEYIAANY